MSSDFEHLLICKILITRDMTPVIDAKITPEYFTDVDHAMVFGFIAKHYRERGEVPLRHMIKQNWPTYKILTVDHEIGWYIDQIRQQFVYNDLMDRLADIKDYMDERDPSAVLQVMAQAVQECQPVLSAAVDVDLVKTWEERLDFYAKIRDEGGKLRGYPTGFQTIDEATNGLQRKQLVTIVGLPKAGKSTILLAIARHILDYGASPLFVGFEMTNDEQGARYDSMVASVDSMSLLGGRMTAEEEDKLERVGRHRVGTVNQFIASADITSATTVSGIGAKIDQYKPSIVFIDGVYLMDDELGESKGSSQALTNITRSLKRLAQQKNVCIVITTQVLASKVSRATGVQASSVGYSSSFAQDSDTLIAVESTEADDVQSLKILLSRNGPRKECEITWEWQTGTFEEMAPEGEEDKKKEAVA